VTDERIPAPLEAIVRAIAGGDDDDQRATTFARGLALGALVGAAIAGSTIWQRRHALGAARSSPTPGEAGDAGVTDRETTPQDDGVGAPRS
jgi:hypothetical protein